MRLIHIKTLELRDYRGETPPPYAVASHRWLPARDEVTFREMSTGTGKDKLGYQKILAFCAAVQRLVDDSPSLRIKLEWLWIDTCCIDKDSYTELPEALNSMFRWYSEAAVCLVWLRGVPTLEAPPAVIRERIEKDEWWTRGWCLQELLAPDLLLFYNCNWEVVARKSQVNGVGFSTKAISLLPITDWISEWTGIPFNVLEDFANAEKITTMEKRTWMKNRVTTRIEDRAYCQLGIFGVYLEFLYGVGDHALIRLEEEIQKKKERDRRQREREQDQMMVRNMPKVSRVPFLRPKSIATSQAHANSEQPGGPNQRLFTVHFSQVAFGSAETWRNTTLTIAGDKTVGDLEDLALRFVPYSMQSYRLSTDKFPTPRFSTHLPRNMALLDVENDTLFLIP